MEAAKDGCTQESKEHTEPPPKTDDNPPDPNEDDLDDLDDLLDEFSPAKLDSKKEAPEASGPGRPTLQSSAAVHDTTDDFTKQLQQEMAALVGEIEGSPEMRQNMEAMMRELNPVMGIKADDNATPNMEREVHSTGASSAVPAQEEGFQETIRKTIERMQASGDQATAAAASNEDDILAQMLTEMQSGGLNDGGSEDDFSKMLMGMMEQLTNKDILYEPMKELHDKFPAWMSKNRSSTAPDDLQRYEEQQRLVGDIVARFERKSYSDENGADREFIVERMQKMQAAGSPPTDLVGDMKDAQDALADLDSGCPQQ